MLNTVPSISYSDSDALGASLGREAQAKTLIKTLRSLL
jgi:hypothetical protein